MGRYLGKRGTVTFSVPSNLLIEDSSMVDIKGLEYYNREGDGKMSDGLSAVWLKNGTNVTTDSGVLVIAQDRADVFRDPRKLEIRFLETGESLKVVYPHNGFALLIDGVDFYDTPRKMYQEHSRGNHADGDARLVYEFLGRDSNTSLRLGLTVHSSAGSWSSAQPHTFEQLAINAPVSLFPDFKEMFAVLTDPAGMWGLQLYIQPSAKSFQHEGSDNVIFTDKSILPVPLSYHPIVAGPGTRLAYFWILQCPRGWEKY